MSRTINPAGLQQAFAPLNGMTILVPEARRVALQGLAEPISSFKKYAAFDLPVVVATLSAEQRRAVAPEPDIVLKQAHTNTTRLRGDLLVNDFAAVASTLTQPAELERLRPVVADIMQFDRSTFPDKLLVVEMHYIQDRPSPDKSFAPAWHRHKTFGEDHDNWDDLLRGGLPPRREYTLRTTGAMEIINDRIGLTKAGRTLMKDVGSRHRTANPIGYDHWLDAIKRQGCFFQPQPYDVVLTTGDVTAHKSHFPIVEEPSALLQLRLISAAPPARKWWQVPSVFGR